MATGGVTPLQPLHLEGDGMYTLIHDHTNVVWIVKKDGIEVFRSGFKWCAEDFIKSKGN